MANHIVRAALLAAGMVWLGGCAASPYYVSASRKAFLPAKGTPAPIGEASFLPDAVVLETPVGYRRAAQLDQAVSGSIIGKRFVFASGDRLASATITGLSSANVPASSFVACGTPNLNIAKTMLSASTLGIGSLFSRVNALSQVCLVDADHDGRLEKAILAGVKRPEDAAPVSVEPASYRVVENEPILGESVARIVYRGKTGMIGGHIGFDLVLIEGGVPVRFQNVRTKVALDKLPQTVQLMGTLFTVKSYDSKDGRITLDILRGFRDGEYGMQPVSRTTYIPIYVPR